MLISSYFVFLLGFLVVVFLYKILCIFYTVYFYFLLCIPFLHGSYAQSTHCESFKMRYIAFEHER